MFRALGGGARVTRTRSSLPKPSQRGGSRLFRNAATREIGARPSGLQNALRGYSPLRATQRPNRFQAVHLDDREEEYDGDQESPPQSTSPRMTPYEDVDEVTGRSKVQAAFDTLVLQTIVFHCPPSETSLRPSELLALIRKRQSTFSFASDCDGMPFSLLIKNCCFLKSFGGRVAFLPIRLGDYREREDYLTTILSDDEVSGRDTFVGLRKYKLREAPSFDGVRTGPQPWLFDGRMIGSMSRRKRHPS